MAEQSILFYVSSLAIILLIAIIKYKAINVSITSLFLYFIAGLTSLYYFYNANYDFTHITIYPIIFALCCTLILFIPFIKYDNVNNKTLANNVGISKYMHQVIVFFALLSVEPLLENIIHLPFVIRNQNMLADIYDSRIGGNNNNYEYLSWVGRKLFWINFLLKDLFPVFLFYYIAKAEHLNKKIIIGLIFGILNPVIHGFALGGRSVTISTTFYIIFVYMLFRQYISTNRSKYIDRIIFYFILCIMALITIVTIARFMSKESSIDIWTWISLYSGEGILNFSNELWTITDVRSNGDNTFLFIRYILGLTDNTDIESLRASRNIFNIRPQVFYTYLGAIYFDFNRIGTIIYVVIFSYIFCKICKIKKQTVQLSQMIYLSILGKFIVLGFMIHTYSLWTDQLSLFFVLLFNWTISFKEKNKRKNIKMMIKQY